jgi:hypothetical protein
VSRSHVALIIASLTVLISTACGVVEVVSVAPPTKVFATRTRVPTFTPTPDWTATPTSTDTATPTPTSTVTNTPAPTSTATPVPPTDTPRPTRKPAAPTDTPTPTAPPATPTPSVDFVVTKQDVMQVIVNGSCDWRHNIFVTVVDKAGAPIDGLTVGDKFNNVALKTGEKGPGQVTFDLWHNSLELLVQLDAAGNAVRSDTTRRLSSSAPEISDMIKGGVCKAEQECQAKLASNSFCYGHYAYEVTFQRTW